MTRETHITVPQDDVRWIARRLSDAGLTVLDTGDRVTTDDGVDAEAVLCVASFEKKDAQEASLQGSRLRR